ncbi:MAG: hypothetical protein ACJASX_002205 [Limisphaerales bacterium]|jgi:hypothetical protein
MKPRPELKARFGIAIVLLSILLTATAQPGMTSNPKEAFGKFDGNRDGSMNPTEFSKMFQGAPFTAIRNRIPIENQQQFQQKLFSQLDQKRRGSFSLQDFLNFQRTGPQVFQTLLRELKAPPSLMPPASSVFGGNFPTGAPGTGTNNTATSTKETKRIALNDAIEEGFVTARFGGAHYRGGIYPHYFQVKRTKASAELNLELTIEAGTIVQPIDRNYSGVRIKGFTSECPKVFRMDDSNTGEKWSLSVEATNPDRRRPRSFLPFEFK